MANYIIYINLYKSFIEIDDFQLLDIARGCTELKSLNLASNRVLTDKGISNSIFTYSHRLNQLGLFGCYNVNGTCFKNVPPSLKILSIKYSEIVSKKLYYLFIHLSS